MQTVKPLRERILAELLGLGERVTASGIVVQSENGKERGIRPRWAKIHLVGEGIDWVSPGQYVLVAHGRWSNQFEVEHLGQKLKLVLLDNKEILAVTDDEPDDNYFGTNTDTSPNAARPEDFGAR